MKTLSYGQTVRITGLRRPYQLVLDQKGYMESRRLPFTEETAKEEMRRGGRSVGFIAIDEAQKPVDHQLVVGEHVQVNGILYTVTAPGFDDRESAALILAAPATARRNRAKTRKVQE